ncbi:PepSY-associated TM helix domain-containing protein [Sphingomonas sp. MMS24-J13]|uniref:PepSY-associated TM helix domain-containing protein n=1 Tax=Sphingomonas sp. MMS24-J13 TaxID=3238686 RepID=UPI00384A7D4C
MSEATKVSVAPRPPKRKLRAWWLKQLHTWHWMSAAVSLMGMLLFAITGLTLNHAELISAKPTVTHRSARLDAALLPLLAKAAEEKAPSLPVPVVSRVKALIHLNTGGRSVEWSEDEAYVAVPRPGGDAWVSIARADGKIESEVTNRGWISYLNDLHKGRNSGSTWFWFIDAFAVACIIFTATGLLLLQLHARHRPSTWPLVGLGLIVPVILAILFIH